MSHERYAVILAGGRGERFWPYSTECMPKQLLALIGGRPLLAQTIERLEGIVSRDRIFIITSESIAPKVRDLLPDVPAAHVIAEPCGRNTAAAIATAAGIIWARHKHAVFSVLPSDHVIKNTTAYTRILRACYKIAEEHDELVTIGIKPTAPSTGYGYIEAREDAFCEDGVPFLRAARFVEKPNSEVARHYLQDGHFFWNAGMFVWSVAALERALGRFRPEWAQWMREVAAHARSSAQLQRFLAERYGGLDNISIDYALMERADNIVTAPGDFGWDDVGTWESLGAHLEKDADGNAIVGEARTLDAQNNTIVSEKRLTALVGVRDLIVVDAEGATLVCHKDHAERVKQLVDSLRREAKWKHLL
jgi:mannose-1-phosphate guanylyltransferase